MNSPRSRGALSDWIAIRLLRRLEHDDAAFYPDVDLRLAQESPRNRNGEISDPQTVLAQRANEVLQTRFGVATAWIQDTIGWMKLIRFVGCVLVLVLAFGMAEPWLSHERTVNVEWLFGFLTMLIVSMTLTAVLMILAGLGGRKQNPGAAGAPTRTFAKLLVVHWLMSFLLQRVLPAIQKRFRKQNSEPSPEEIRQQAAVSEAAFDVMSDQSRRVALEAAATSNLVWLLLSTGVFLSLGKMGLFREYDFRWQATIVSTDFMKDASQLLSRPIAGWPLVEVPTDADVTWLATGEIAEATETGNTTGAAKLTVQQTRQRWGRLFLAFVLYYGVLPRALLTLIAFALAKRGWRQLQPDLHDTYVRNVLARIQTPPFSTEVTDHAELERATPANELARQQSAASEEAPPGSVPAVAANVAPSGAQASTTNPTGSSEPAETPVADLPLGSLTAICSFDTPPSDESWTKTLAFDRHWQLLDLGNAGSRADRQRVLGALEESSNEIGLLLIVANLLDNPDGLFEDFLQRTHAAILQHARRGLILLGGERVRQRYDGDADQVARRVALWKRKATALGTPADAVLEFDAEHQTSASRAQLHQQLAQLQPKNDGTGTTEPLGTIHTAGQLSRATALIAGAAHRDVVDKSEEDLQADAARLHGEIRELYQRQATELDKAFRSVKIDTNRMRAAIRDTAGDATATLDSLTHFSQMADRIGRYTSGLSGRWAVASGLVCGIGSGALAIAAAPAALPALLPAAFIGAKTGLLGGVFGAHIKHIAGKLRRGGGGSETDKSNDNNAKQPEDMAFSLDDLVRANALWALVLEFQGTREELIAKLLREILKDDDQLLTTSEDAQRWLSELTANTDRVVAAFQASTQAVAGQSRSEALPAKASTKPAEPTGSSPAPLPHKNTAQANS